MAGHQEGGRRIMQLLVVVMAVLCCPWSSAAFGGGGWRPSRASPGSSSSISSSSSSSSSSSTSRASSWALHSHAPPPSSSPGQQPRPHEQQQQQQQAASLLDFLLERSAAEPSLGPPPSPSELWARVESLQRTFFGGPGQLLAQSTMANVTTMCQRAPDIVLMMDRSTLRRRVAERQGELRELLGPHCNPLRLIIKTPALLLDEFVHARVVCERLREEFDETFELGKVVNANPALLIRHWDGLAEKIGELRALFKRQDLGRIVNKRPDLLSRDVGKLREKMDGMVAMLPEAVDVPSLVARHPELLGRNLSLLERNYDGLRGLFGQVDLASMLNRKPSLLLASTDRVLVPKLARLTAMLTPAAALRIAELQPSIFNRDMDRVAARLDALRRHLPDMDAVRFVLGCPGFLVAEADVGERLKGLRHALGLPADTDVDLLAQVLALEPRIYAEDLQVLATKVAAVLKATEMTPAEMASKLERDSRFLAVPYPSLVARCDFLGALLGPAGIQRISLSSMGCMPLRRFGELHPTYEAYLKAKLAEAAGPAAKGGPPPAVQVGEGAGGDNARRRWMGGLLGLEREYGTLLWRELSAAVEEGGRSGGAGGASYPFSSRDGNGVAPSPRPSSPSRSRQPPSASMSLSKQPQPVLSSR